MAKKKTEKEATEAADDEVQRRERLGEAAADAEAAAAAQRSGEEADQRSAQEREENLAAGAIEPAGIKPTESDSEKSSEQLRAEVDEARERLAGTVEELSGKVDPRPRVADAKQGVRRRADETTTTVQSNPVPIAAVAVAVAVVVVLIWRRRR